MLIDLDFDDLRFTIPNLLSDVLVFEAMMIGLARVGVDMRAEDPLAIGSLSELEGVFPDILQQRMSWMTPH